METDPDGVVRVAKTRATLDTVVTAFLKGCMPEEIGEQYPSLQLPDIHLVIGQYVSDKKTKSQQHQPNKYSCSQ
ncbi:DUF433 domain-containing protein [Nostoc sp. PCC 7107]|uniref:DUF433 domain-containing protein n=1 Tax=Nostoc sp. PCC 7107 TaxID=317936 RepID=UPI000A036D51|nr:DUF433 domain-containing protein [Nostoc sp. PCC 7107]